MPRVKTHFVALVFGPTDGLVVDVGELATATAKQK
jgi:hypothetical protein